MLGCESIVNTVAIAECPTTKKKHPRCKRHKKTSTGTKDENAAAVSKRNHAAEAHKPIANQFYLGSTNGSESIDEALVRIGWLRVHELGPKGAKLMWVDNWKHLSLVEFKEGQFMVNRIPKSDMLTNKLSLLTNLQRYERVRLSCGARNQLSLWLYEFVPETYRLDDKIDRKAFMDAFKEGDIWICKPAAMNRGKGIYLVRDIRQLRENLAARDERKKQHSTWHVTDDRIIQRYIMKPLLLDWRKFDIRAYMLVASMAPYLVLYHEGYARLCLLEYDSRETNLMAHLTNQCVQRQSCAYLSGKENTVWSMDRLNDYINRQVAPHKNLETDWVFNSLTRRMKLIMLHCFQAVRNHFVSKVGFFELYGFDFLIDNEMNVWLIEINQNPSMATNCRVLRDIVPEVLANTLYVAIECFEKNCHHSPLLPLDADTNFHLLFHDSMSFDRFGIIPSATFRDVSLARNDNLLENAQSPKRNGPETARQIATAHEAARQNMNLFRGQQQTHDSATVNKVTKVKTDKRVSPRQGSTEV
ncbi:Protein polyglycylase TTLL10 [Lamellibrachia satsuma]|nr:Protein polyglycylase TTLL10 [Lamellibrachia satsuma]